MSHLTRRRTVYGLLFVLFVPIGTACTWKHYELAPAPAADGVSSPTIRIIKRDGSQLTLRAAQLRGDTLHGLLANGPRGVVAVPIADVREVQARKLSVLGLLYFIPAVALLLW